MGLTTEEAEEMLTLAQELGDEEAELEALEALERGGALGEAQSKPTQPLAGGVTREMLQGLTLGFSDEIGAAMATGMVMAGGENRPAREVYDEILGGIRADQAQFREERPKTAMAAQLAGGLATGGAGLARTAAPKVAAIPLSIKQQAIQQGAKGALTGGGMGAVAGAGFSEAETTKQLAGDTVSAALLGAGFGGAASALMPAVGSAIRTRLGVKSNVLDDAGRVTDEFIDELDDAIKKGAATAGQADDVIAEEFLKAGIMTPDSSRRFNLFVKRGVTPLKAQLTQLTDDFRSLQDVAKSSNAVSRALAEQETELVGAIEQGISKIAPSTDDIIGTNHSLLGAVQKVGDTLDDQVSKVYANISANLSGEKVIPVKNMLRSFDRTKGDNTLAGGVPSSFNQILRNLDITNKSTGNITVATAEKIRKSLNSKHQGANPQGRMLIKEYKNVIDDTVESAVGKDVFKPAREAKIFERSVFERASKSGRDVKKTLLLDKIRNNEIKEEDIFKRLIKAPDDEFLHAKSFYLTQSGKEGKQAWANLKAQEIRDALIKATGTQGKAEGGGRVFNANKFKDHFKRLRESKKWGELFSEDERELIDDIIEIGFLRIPQGRVQQGSGPSAPVMLELKRELNKKIPLLGEKLDFIMAPVESVKTFKAAKAQVDPMATTKKTFGRRK